MARSGFIARGGIGFGFLAVTFGYGYAVDDTPTEPLPPPPGRPGPEPAIRTGRAGPGLGRARIVGRLSLGAQGRALGAPGALQAQPRALGVSPEAGRRTEAPPVPVAEVEASSLATSVRAAGQAEGVAPEAVEGVAQTSTAAASTPDKPQGGTG